jgi:hypothetical protein
MPLTLCPTCLSRDPDDQDWTVHDDGAEIGRLYEDLQTNRPENRWFWSITVMRLARGHMRTSAVPPRSSEQGRVGRVQGGEREQLKTRSPVSALARLGHPPVREGVCRQFTYMAYKTTGDSLGRF